MIFGRHVRPEVASLEPRLDRLIQAAADCRDPSVFRSIGLARDFLTDGNQALAEQLTRSVEAQLGLDAQGEVHTSSQPATTQLDPFAKRRRFVTAIQNHRARSKMDGPAQMPLGNQ